MRKLARAPDPGSVPAPPRRPGPGAWLLAGVLIALLACGGRSGALDAIPEELHGYWSTEDARYADRGFLLNDNVVIFYTGDETLRAERLQAIDTTHQGDRILYELRYRSAEGQLYYFDFFYANAPVPSIRFKNQQDITWRKGETPPY